MKQDLRNKKDQLLYFPSVVDIRCDRCGKVFGGLAKIYIPGKKHYCLDCERRQKALKRHFGNLIPPDDGFTYDVAGFKRRGKYA